MKVTEPEESEQYTALYQATILQAVGGASALMARLVAAARAALREQENSSTEPRERDSVTHLRRLLNQSEPALCERFTDELLSGFTRMASVERAVPAAASGLQFDQLASMDETALQQSVASARVLHNVQIAADSALEELNGLICTMLGLGTVRLERNPLRPAVYVDSVSAALTQLPLPSAARKTLLGLMLAALGRELGVYYRQLCAQLRERGVANAAPPEAASGPTSAPFADLAANSPSRQAGLLTLEKLRHLLAGHAAGAAAAVSQRFEMDASPTQATSGFGDSVSVPGAFRPTVPAAFEAIKGTGQLDAVVQRIEQRNANPAVSDQAAQQAREKLRASAHGLDQALSLEVVALMVENITSDQRLLGPVQRIVAEMEPALLQMALVDPRFFSHKQHPARRLLHEITHRSIAFESVDSRGFSGFMEPLREAVAPLSEEVIDTAEPFDKALSRLIDLWDEPAVREKRQLAKAVKALQKAEQRNALAETIVMEMRARPDALLVPYAVLDFLCGPWAQVVAHARMTDNSGADDPGHYAELIEGLLWSAQPELTRKNVSALTRLVPKLLIRLRGGLATIDYPGQKTSEFFEVLMKLHQRGFQSGAAETMPQTEPPRAAPTVPAGLSGGSGRPWIAPTEAQASGFIDLAPQPPTEATPMAAETQMDALVVGVWVALQVEGNWTRTRLSWASPRSSLLLFTDALGYMQTLTRNACEQLIGSGQLRLIPANPVEDALDAVAQAAMRNSVDVRF